MLLINIFSGKSIFRFVTKKWFQIVYWHYSNYDKFLVSTTLFSDMELKKFCSINIATYTKIRVRKFDGNYAIASKINTTGLMVMCSRKHVVNRNADVIKSRI